MTDSSPTPLPVSTTDPASIAEQLGAFAISTRMPMCVIDGNIKFANPAMEKLTGLPTQDLIGKPFEILLAEEHESQSLSIVRSFMLQGRGLTNFDAKVIREDGQYHWCNIILENWQSSRQLSVVTIIDIEERKSLEEQLRNQTFFDGVTGLPNRVLFLDRLQQTMARVQRSSNILAVVVVNLKNFKQLNADEDQQVGALLLKKVASRLRGISRSEDTVARVGMEDFAVLLELSEVGLLQEIGNRINVCMAQPYQLDDQDITIFTGIGVAHSDRKFENAEQLLSSAYVAVQRTKSDDKSSLEILDATSDSIPSELKELEVELNQAINNNQFDLKYQPIVDLISGQISGFEALLRWKHPSRGCISPNVFIPIAEDSGAIIEIGEWVLWQACRQLKFWQEKFKLDEKVSVSVNISAAQARHTELDQLISKVLQGTQLHGKCLRLEMSESSIMSQPERINELMSQLRKTGIQLYVDDFGTGYSSLSYLNQLPIDILKIDQTFLNNIDSNLDNKEVINSVITLAQNLNVDVIAEGLENQEQLRYLLTKGCTQAQGYYLARPMSVLEIEKLLTDNGDDQIKM